jgi:hypothetical protein
MNGVAASFVSMSSSQHAVRLVFAGLFFLLVLYVVVCVTVGTVWTFLKGIRHYWYIFAATFGGGGVIVSLILAAFISNLMTALLVGFGIALIAAVVLTTMAGSDV